MAEQSTKIPTVFDSEEQQVGEVYARALLASVPSQDADAIVDEFESLVRDVLDRNHKLETILANPKMPVESKWELLDRVFAGRMSVKLLTFMKVVARRHRLNAIRAIQRAATRLRDETAGRIQVQVTVPQPLNDGERSSLVERLKTVFKKDIRMDISVDPSILGGLVIRVGDTVFDGSINGQLQSLRKTVGARSENALRAAAANLMQAN
ncbi:MAG: ATP synthase F1 subunit delta [Planctomycetota bacterium]|jgi:F-type H+-transporting ATPase subunit delta